MTKFKKIKGVLFGCGHIGCSIVSYVVQRSEIKLIGAIDNNKNLIGLDLGDVADIGKKINIKISDNIDKVLSIKPDIVFHATNSSLRIVTPQIIKCAKAGVNVVSTCEELSYPFRKDPRNSAEIDKIAKNNNITILATGVNPGFLMDTWPLFMTAVCQRVEKVKAVRFQDASNRRGPFQRKIGAGLDVSEFNELVAVGTIKHVGLVESIDSIASGLGWRLDDVTECIKPVVAQKPIKTQFVDVRPGQVAGVRQIGKGIFNGMELIILEFKAVIGASESYDAVYINGIPSLEVIIKGGTHGDIATAAIIVNAAQRIIEAQPGLLTMQDIPIVIAHGA